MADGLGLPVAMAGLPASSARVGVGPPSLLSGPKAALAVTVTMPAGRPNPAVTWSLPPLIVPKLATSWPPVSPDAIELTSANAAPTSLAMPAPSLAAPSRPPEPAPFATLLAVNVVLKTNPVPALSIAPPKPLPPYPCPLDEKPSSPLPPRAVLPVKVSSFRLSRPVEPL